MGTQISRIGMVTAPERIMESMEENGFATDWLNLEDENEEDMF